MFVPAETVSGVVKAKLTMVIFADAAAGAELLVEPPVVPPDVPDWPVVVEPPLLEHAEARTMRRVAEPVTSAFRLMIPTRTPHRVGSLRPVTGPPTPHQAFPDRSGGRSVERCR